jgi:hypothetical protein
MGVFMLGTIHTGKFRQIAYMTILTVGAFVMSIIDLDTVAYGQAAKAKGRSGAVREKHLSREKTMKTRDATKLDFDAADIGGNRKAPMGSFLNQNKADKEYDFVKIRLRWVPEMVQSSASLDSGKAR